MLAHPLEALCPAWSPRVRSSIAAIEIRPSSGDDTGRYARNGDHNRALFGSGDDR
jgi:hypothetical protein